MWPRLCLGWPLLRWFGRGGGGGGSHGRRALWRQAEGEAALRRVLGAGTHWGTSLHVVLQRRQGQPLPAVPRGLQPEAGGEVLLPGGRCQAHFQICCFSSCFYMGTYRVFCGCFLFLTDDLPVFFYECIHSKNFPFMVFIWNLLLSHPMSCLFFLHRRPTRFLSLWISGRGSWIFPLGKRSSCTTLR